MSSRNVKFRYNLNGVPTDVTTAVLRDPTGAFGLRRVSNGAVVLPQNTAIPRISAGRYLLAVPGLTAGVQYEYWVEWTVGGETDRRQKFFTITSDVDPVSRYTTYPRFIRKWGTKVVAEATQKESKALEPNLEVVQDAFEFADDEIDTELQGGVLKVPLDFTAWAGYIPAKVKNWADTLALAYAFETRGWQERKNERHRMVGLSQSVYQELQLYKNGLKQMNAATSADTAGTAVSVAGEAAGGVTFWVRYPDGGFVLV
jgi:hypothetical protein